MAVDTINRLNTFTTFIEAAVDPVGREDRVGDLTIKNYNENPLSETSVKALSSEDCEEELNCEYTNSRAHPARFILEHYNVVNKRQPRRLKLG